MDNTLNIIEIIDGKYNLNAQQLQSALALAEGCDSIALISIVGPKNSGKTFLIKCLLSYMKCENKDEWPQKEEFIEMNYRLTDEDNDRKPVIKLTQNPYIMREWKTAVFLIDTDFVFDLEMSSKQENNILELLLLTSSTVIYNYKRYLPVPQFTRLENTITALSSFDSSLDSMKNIMFLIRDWSPEDHNNEFRFGLYDGSLYLNNFLKRINMNDKYADLNCCLMSAPNHDQHSEHINLSELCLQFLKDVKTLFSYKLINFDEMQLKRKLNSRNFMNSNELLKLFEGCVQILNENSMNANLIDVNEKLKPEDSLRYETEISKNTVNTESNDIKSMINNKIDETLESRKPQLNNKYIINIKMKRSEEQNKRRGIDSNNFNFDSINSTTTQTDSESNANSSIVFIENDETLKGEETNKYNNEGTQPDLIDLTVDTDDDVIACSASTGSTAESSDDSKNDKSFTELMSEVEYDSVDSISLRNQSYDSLNSRSQQSIDITQTENEFNSKEESNPEFNEQIIRNDIKQIAKSIQNRKTMKKENKESNVSEEWPTEADSNQLFREFHCSEIFQNPQRKPSQSEDKLSNTQNSDWSKNRPNVGHKYTKVKEKDKTQVNVLKNKGTEGNSQVNKSDEQTVENEVINETSINFDALNGHSLQSLDIINKESDFDLKEKHKTEYNDHKQHPTETDNDQHFSHFNDNKISQNPQQKSTESKDKQLVPQLYRDKYSHYLKTVEIMSANDSENDNQVVNDVKTDEMYNKTDEMYNKTDEMYNKTDEMYNKTDQQIANEKEVIDELLIKCSLKTHFESLVEKLLLEYKKDMETKLKDQYLDFDEGLSQTHYNIKQKIFGQFKDSSYDIKYDKFFQEFKVRYYLIIDKRMDEELNDYNNKLEAKLSEARQQYERFIKQMLIVYDMEMELLFDKQLQNNLKTKSVAENHIISKEKALKVFREETVKFYKGKEGNIEKEFNNKLNDMIDKEKDKFSTFIHYYNVFESEEKKIFSQYVSESKILHFCEKQKSQMIESLKSLKDQDLILFANSMIQKSITVLKENNNQIERKERDFANNAIDLAFRLYEKCFEEKLKTSFYKSEQVIEIRDKLFEYTLKLLIKSCHFNEYQNYLIHNCEEGLKLKVNQSIDKKATEYQRKVDQTLILLKQAIKNAIEKYYKEMNVTLSKRTYLKSNEFAELHHKCSKKANELFDDFTHFLKTDFEAIFAKNKLLEYQSVLRQSISTERDKLKIQNEKNTPTINSMAIYLGESHMIAATYRYNKVELIEDKIHERFVPNSILFGNQILFGTEAKSHYETSFPDLKSYHNFDIKQLFGRDRSSITYEDLGKYPFRFLKDKLSVYVDFYDSKFELSIESLLALMILDIKSKAEKQIGNKMSNIVLTVPTNYSINQKKCVKNAAKIAGLGDKDFDLLTEMNAIAINYAYDRAQYKKKFTVNVLFVILNDYECDAAICQITNERIEYKVYFHENLMSTEEEKKKVYQKLTNLLNNKTQKIDFNVYTRYRAKTFIEDLFKLKDLKNLYIQDCIITGNSTLLEYIRDLISKYVRLNISYTIDALLMKGSTIYGEMLSNKIDLIEISEVTTLQINYNFNTKYLKGKTYTAIPQNTILPNSKRIEFINLPKNEEFPLILNLFQEKQTIATNVIQKLPVYNYNTKYCKHIIDFSVNRNGDRIDMISYISNKTGTSALKLETIAIIPGLSDEEICLEKEKINALLAKIEEKKKFNEEKLCLDQVICELSSYCVKVKNEVENNQELRPLIKKQIYLELDKTLTFLSSDKLDLNSVKEQNKMLTKTLKSYMN